MWLLLAAWLMSKAKAVQRIPRNWSQSWINKGQVLLLVHSGLSVVNACLVHFFDLSFYHSPSPLTWMMLFFCFMFKFPHSSQGLHCYPGEASKEKKVPIPVWVLPWLPYFLCAINYIKTMHSGSMTKHDKGWGLWGSNREVFSSANGNITKNWTILGLTWAT